MRNAKGGMRNGKSKICFDFAVDFAFDVHSALKTLARYLLHTHTHTSLDLKEKYYIHIVYTPNTNPLLTNTYNINTGALKSIARTFIRALKTFIREQKTFISGTGFS
jgi:hypothetical protein